MFLPPGTDNPSYATASARQCKCGHFSLLYREQERALRCRPIVRTHPTAGLGSPVLGVWGQVGDRVPPSRCTSAFWQVRQGDWDPAAARRFAWPPIIPRRRPIVSGVRRGRVAIPWPAVPGADRPLCFPGHGPPLAPSPGRSAMFRACPRQLCWSIDRVPTSAGNRVGGRSAIAPYPPSHPRSRW